MTKFWTAVVVVKLAQEKKLSLGDTLGTWWPSLFKGDKARITIRQLLNHSSLMGRLERNPSVRFDDLLEIRAAAALPLLAPPGRNWHYSNIGYMTAGHIAEEASG